MNKSDIVKIGVVILVLLFLVEPISRGFLVSGPQETPVQETQDQYSGFAVLNVTIDYYERVLYVSAINSSFTDKLNSDERVDSVELVEGFYQINLKKREDVRPLFNEFKSAGLVPFTNAKVILPEEVNLYDEKGNKITAFFANRKIKIPTIPIVPEGSTVGMNVNVWIFGQDAYINPEVQPQFITETKMVQLQGTILESEKSEIYIVPWEERNEVDIEKLSEEYGEGEVDYSLKNSIRFPVPLSPQQQVAGKYDYVEYISDSVAILSGDMVDKEKVLSDFGGDVIFDNSTLVIKTNATGIEYSKIETYTHSIELSSSEYELLSEIKNITAESENGYSTGETVSVGAEATMIGNTIAGISVLEIN
ncbi:hypothetical protein JXB01_03120 [Candidatus Micrarchaeota archaeon]|nr:hypothetical protein [Candidatus Micrarchaeota archaeon]